MDLPYFSLSGITALEAIPKNSSIHVIGVCGVAMAPLAIALAEQGFVVSGSDKEFFEPMGSLLKKSPVTLLQGFSAENIPADCKLVVIGNAVTKGNVEVVAVGEKGYAYTIFPKLLRDTVIGDRHSIVVSGTHGKTTTTSMAAATLQGLSLDPSYFIGGQALNFPVPLHIGSGKFSAVEGDEYDSSFFAKVPKFSFYDPNTLIITSIEFDHADIYSSLEDIEKQFSTLVASMANDSIVIANIQSPAISRLLPEWRKVSKAKFVTYLQPLPGQASPNETITADYHITGLIDGEPLAHMPDGSTVALTLRAPGAHNAGNALAVFAALHLRGFAPEAIASALATFKGVMRRQELKVDGSIKLIDDFAHHPTAVFETLSAIRLAYKPKRLIALFEPRSATSRRKIFQHDYSKAFAGNCDRCFMLAPKARELDNPNEMMNVKDLAVEISKTGTPAASLESGEELFREVVAILQPGDVVICMSNGAFEGVLAKLTEYLKNQHLHP